MLIPLAIGDVRVTLTLVRSHANKENSRHDKLQLLQHHLSRRQAYSWRSDRDVIILAFGRHTEPRHSRHWAVATPTELRLLCSLACSTVAVQTTPWHVECSNLKRRVGQTHSSPEFTRHLIQVHVCVHCHYHIHSDYKSGLSCHLTSSTTTQFLFNSKENNAIKCKTGCSI